MRRTASSCLDHAGSLDGSPQSLRRCSGELAHSTLLHSCVKSLPSNPGIKHLSKSPILRRRASCSTGIGSIRPKASVGKRASASSKGIVTFDVPGSCRDKVRSRDRSIVDLFIRRRRPDMFSEATWCGNPQASTARLENVQIDSPLAGAPVSSPRKRHSNVFQRRGTISGSGLLVGRLLPPTYGV